MKTNISDDELRAAWVMAGGAFHGPNVETGTMPEAQLLLFLRGLMEDAQAVRVPSDDALATARLVIAKHRSTLSGLGRERDEYTDDPTARFMDDVTDELKRARAKFPGDRIMTIALAEEFGELAKAMLDEPGANVWNEAVQTAVMAARVAIDGDSSVDDWRAEKGLGNHRNRGVVIADSRRNAPYYVLVKPWAVYVKEGDFFRQQGGLTDDWGKQWMPVAAGSIEGARAMGEQMRAQP